LSLASDGSATANSTASLVFLSEVRRTRVRGWEGFEEDEDE
jgi:hypothetical protein